MTDQPRDLTRLRFTTTVRYTATIDLVDYFTRLGHHDADRAAYWALDPTDILPAWEEYARPLAWLDDDLDTDLVDGALVTVTHHGAWEITGEPWTEADFEALADAVPWLRTPPTKETPQ